MKHLKIITAWAVVGMLFVANATYADVLASKSGKCPTDYTPYVKYGATHCRTPEKAEKPSKSSGSKSASSSSSSAPAEARPWDNTRTYANRPVTASLQKNKESDLCPTGYFTNRTELMKCETHFENAPKSRLKGGGACAAGETLERGIYCSGATTMTPGEMSGAATADFNELYTALSIKNNKVPELSSAEPEIYAATASQRQAAKAQEQAAEQPGGAAPAGLQLGNPADLLKQGLKGLFGQ